MSINFSTPGSSILVTGPTRSGKSEWAEQLALLSNRTVTYIATAQAIPEDPEWLERIRQHQQRRPTSWRLWEIPQALPAALEAGSSEDCFLVDSLGTWTANLLETNQAAWQEECRRLLDALVASQSDIILVAEETGWGVVPAYPLGRQFRDRLGALTRQVAHCTQHTYLVVAGYAVELSTLGQAVDTGRGSLNK